MKGKRGGAKIGADFLARESPSKEFINLRKEQKARIKTKIKKLEFTSFIGKSDAIKEGKNPKDNK
jgi:hypothetical protein